MEALDDRDEHSCIFSLRDAPSSRALLGNKANNLVALHRLGLPVPPAFVLSTRAYARWRRDGDRLPSSLAAEVRVRLEALASEAEVRLGSPAAPLLVSVRSGAAVSMPGAMSTLLDVGITPAMAEAWSETADDADASFHAGAYARLLRGLLHASAGTEHHVASLDAIQGPPRHRLAALAQLARAAALPDDPIAQVLRAIDEVFRSWDSPGARSFRRTRGIADDLGTAVIVQRMVFGDRDARSATGLVATRDPTTGAPGLSGGFLVASQGEDVVGPDGPTGLRPIEQLVHHAPVAAEELLRFARRIERHFEWPQDLEFTVESDRLWLLQARAAPLTARAAVRVAVELVHEGVLAPEQAVERVSPAALDAVRRPRFAPGAIEAAIRDGRLVASGLAAAPGVACGPVVLAGSARAGILVRDALDPVDDLEAIEATSGLLSVRGGTASHASTLARLLGKPYVTGCERMRIDLDRRAIVFDATEVADGTIVSIDGNSGQVFLGEIATELEPAPPELDEFLGWHRAHRSSSAWQSASYLDRVEEREDHRGRARAILATAPWRSAKAIAVDLVRDLLPPALRIPQFVTAARDRARLRELMLEGLARGYWIGLRPCYSVKTFGKGTWQMGLRTADDVDGFLERADFQGPLKAGGYPSWIANEALDEIICVWDPPGKGLAELAPREFAFSVSCLPGVVQVELVLGTVQVRYLEGAASDRLIHLRMELDHGAPRARGRRTIRVGRNYLTADAGTAGPLELPEDTEADPRVQPAALRIARAVARAVFVDWWDPPVELPHVMCALDSEVGLHGLEFQGRTNDDGVEYMLLFDVKGAEESRMLGPRSR